ncbi:MULTISPECIES: acetate/propionate family kinase [Micrococcus]|uniref:Acetate kinase n=2 Tax=Actinomycetes TaxID=1760 RepID=A0ABD7M754_MICLU|nr:MULTISPECIES: acetate kinase [Micrococcus]OOL30681.1 acetate kinase [Rhodococcus rhodochrous]AWD24937.1 acetate kinase [Micrococcus luteus]KIK87055.1 acetate kinase [Micrococcus luteus]MBY0174021.1 acetate kinase [Micrococcus luteus]MCT1811652.1 acetate kinase [Micrococcus luteus]
MLVLVINSGSSSLKYQLRELADDGTDAPVPVLAQGLVERIGVPGSGVPDHAAALEQVEAELAEATGGRTIDAAGHRVVHGGERFTAPARVTNEVIRAIERLAPLAPLHNPAAAQGLRAMAERWPDMPQVVVFDTSFHQTMPREAWQYALPDEVYTEHGIRRYGFHGTSHDLVTGLAAEHLGIPRGEFRAVVLHLGNGASATAIRDGVSVDTSMGYTPLAGLVMGTRSGDLDPSVVTHLMRNHGYDAEELDTLMNRRSGLLGLAGEADMRQVLENAASGDGRARNALDVASYRLAKYVGGYHVAVGGAQAIVFTAGIGENSAPFRARVLDRLGALGVAYDAEANRARVAGPHTISAPESAIPVLVVPTDEEQAIARLTWELAR